MVRTDRLGTLLTRQVTSVSVCPARDDIALFLRFRLSEDETPDAMDRSLEADILEKIPENVSDMCVVARALRTQYHIIR